jgi:membrane protease YdiL (CAAX protease family)
MNNDELNKPDGNDNNQLPPVAPNPFKKPDLKSAQLLFLVVFLLLIIFGSMAQAWHFQYGMIITQLFIILLPALVYWKRFKPAQSSFSRFASLKIKYLPAILIMAVSFWVINMVFATGLVFGLMEIGYEPIVAIEPPQTLQQYLSYIVVLVIFAGICEEVLFRGTIMPAMEDHGLVAAIVYSSLLFALLHVSLLNLVSTFVLGVVMAVIVIKTGSIWGAIIYHMINNFIAATYLYIAGQYETTAEVELQGLLALLPFFILGLVGAWLGLRLLHRQSGSAILLRNGEQWLPKGWFAWPFVVGVILYLFMVLLELAVGFKWIDISMV